MTDAKKRLSIALAISIALNLFGAGFLVARALHRRDLGGRAPAAQDLIGGGPFVGPRGLLGGEVGPRAEPHVREVMRAHGEELRRGHGELRERRRAVEQALRAEPFDAAALRNALAGLRSSTDAAQQRMHAALVDLAGKLPPEERHALARHHGRGRRGRMPMHHGGGAGSDQGR